MGDESYFDRFEREHPWLYRRIKTQMAFERFWDWIIDAPCLDVTNNVVAGLRTGKVHAQDCECKHCDDGGDFDG